MPDESTTDRTVTDDRQMDTLGTLKELAVNDLQRLLALFIITHQEAEGILRHRVAEEDRQDAVADKSTIGAVELQ